MHPSSEKISAVENWFSEEFPGHVVESHELISREAILYRAHEPRPRAPRFELIVSFEAFDDNPIDTIVGDLRARRAGDLLRRESPQRLMYDRFRRIVAAPE